MTNCPKCGRLVEKLIKLDDAFTSAQYTQLTGVPYFTSDHYCITCARMALGISDEDLIKEERALTKNPSFLINLIKGRIGQVIIEGIFRNFGYEVYPYGYESYLTNIIKNLRKTGFDSTVRQIRSTPDTLVYDRELNEGFLLEIKSTTLSPDNYWIRKDQLEQYQKLWSAAVLVVVHTPTLEIFCKTIEQIDLASLTVTSPNFANQKKGYSINLVDKFVKLSDLFRLIEQQELNTFIETIKNEILDKYGS